MVDHLGAFEAFDRDHPEVYRLFCNFAQDLIKWGHTRGSAREIVEQIRWHGRLSFSRDTYGINNDHIPKYARKWLSKHPEHPKFFELRGDTCGMATDGNGQGVFCE